jgi:dTDP-4-amino-4,6-dideoxygalactose transaminase
MKPIRMVDLATQYQHIKSEIDSAIMNVLGHCGYINGPEVKAFQASLESYLNVKHVIPCANGTDALQVAMMALGLKPGDEVITASFTYVATAEVISLLGLTPVLVDVYPETFNIDPSAIEAAITPKTKAIVPVHLFGQCADMESIMDIARKHNLFVIEDTAQAIGAEYTFKDGSKKYAGTIGKVGTTSFFPSKNLGCYGDGGAIFTNDDALADNLRMICNHGQSKLYTHDVIGVNSRLDSIQAAVLNTKLAHLNQYSSKRVLLADSYDRAFANEPKLSTPKRTEHSTHVFHQYTLKLNGLDRMGLKTYMESKGIPCMIYYPIPLHMQKAFKDERYKEGMFPVTEMLCSCVVSLPMHTEMDEEQINYVTINLLNYLKN